MVLSGKNFELFVWWFSNSIFEHLVARPFEKNQQTKECKTLGIRNLKFNPAICLSSATVPSDARSGVPNAVPNGEQLNFKCASLNLWT